jgi:Holliday junction resolvase
VEGDTLSQLESKIQSRILKGLKEAGIYAHKNIATNRSGIPDIIACVDGAYVALEVKSPGGKPTELQLYNIEQIRKSGGIAEIVYSWEDVAKLIRSLHE